MKECDSNYLYLHAERVHITWKFSYKNIVSAQIYLLWVEVYKNRMLKPSYWYIAIFQYVKLGLNKWLKVFRSAQLAFIERQSQVVLEGRGPRSRLHSSNFWISLRSVVYFWAITSHICASVLLFLNRDKDNCFLIIACEKEVNVCKGYWNSMAD